MTNINTNRNITLPSSFRRGRTINSELDRELKINGIVSGIELGETAQTVITQIDNILLSTTNLCREAFERIVSDGEQIITEKLKNAKRIIKYEEKTILAPEFMTVIDDNKIIQARGATMPFLEEKQVESPNYEDIKAFKEDASTREITFIEEKIQVELPPNPILFKIHFNDEILRRIWFSENHKDLISHIEYYFRIIQAAANIINDNIQVMVCIEKKEEAKIIEELINQFNLNKKISIEIKKEHWWKDEENMVDFRIKSSRKIEEGFELFSGEMDIFPIDYNQKTRLGNNLEYTILLNKGLNRTRTIVNDFIINSLKKLYEI